MSDYYVFSAALLQQLERVAAPNSQEAVRAGAVTLGVSGRVACVAVDAVQLSEVSLTSETSADVTPL